MGQERISLIEQDSYYRDVDWRSEAELRGELLKLWAVMGECVDNGCSAEKLNGRPCSS